MIRFLLCVTTMSFLALALAGCRASGHTSNGSGGEVQIGH
jgi:hypothetical protein